MSTIRLQREEWWPVWQQADDDDPWEDATVDVPDALVDRWRAAEAEFDAVQGELWKLVDAAGGVKSA